MSCYTIVNVQTKLKIIAIVVAGLIVVSIAILYITRSHAVIYRSGSGTTAEQSGFVIENPFRERGPEDEAEKMLRDLKAGNCAQVLALPAVNAETIADRCSHEAASPLETWSIVDRSDIGKQTILVYTVDRTQHGETGHAENYSTLAWIDVEKIGEDRWRVLSYQSYY